MRTFSTLDSLKPKQKQLVIEAAEAAGFNTTEWKNSPTGAANPAYCYKWSFVQPGKVVVLNLWYRDFNENGKRIEYHLNPKRDAARTPHTAAGRTWKSRASALNADIQFAIKQELPIRVIVCDGKRRDVNELNPKASRVTARELDAEPWHVETYNPETGDYLLVRGTGISTKDQFDTTENPDPTERRSITGEAYIRSAEVRRNVLNRSRGKCEYCNAPGFLDAAGSRFLETHHVIPLSREGPDTETNVVAICANHHREAHYGQDAELIRAWLLSYLSKIYQPN